MAQQVLQLRWILLMVAGYIKLYGVESINPCGVNTIFACKKCVDVTEAACNISSEFEVCDGIDLMNPDYPECLVKVNMNTRMVMYSGCPNAMTCDSSMELGTAQRCFQGEAGVHYMCLTKNIPTSPSTAYPKFPVVCPALDNLDLVVLQDFSRSISIPGGLDTVRTFLLNLLSNFEPNSRNIHRSLYTFSSSVTLVWSETNAISLEDALNSNLTVDAQNTDTAGALGVIPMGDPMNCKILVIVTDGKSDDPSSTASAAMNLNSFLDYSTCVVPVGCVTCDAEDELNVLAGDSPGRIVEDANGLLDPVWDGEAAARCVCDLCTK